MEIIKQTYDWSSPLTNRTRTEYGIIHHEAGRGMSAQQIHKMHRDVNKWPGIGYHFYVRLDGSVYEGRPINTIGTHTASYNNASIGICFEGNYEVTSELPHAQYQSGVELIAYIMRDYPGLKWRRHKDLNATACPGQYFPFTQMIEEAEIMALSGEQINEKARAYRSELDESAWSKKEGAWAKATKKGAVNGERPRDYITREEFVAVLDRLGVIK